LGRWWKKGNLEEGNMLEVWWIKELWNLSILSILVFDPWSSASFTVSE
jgi:hypothetical protein